jgi:hypothetical protein
MMAGKLCNDKAPVTVVVTIGSNAFSSKAAQGPWSLQGCLILSRPGDEHTHSSFAHSVACAKKFQMMPTLDNHCAMNDYTVDGIHIMAFNITDLNRRINVCQAQIRCQR